MDRQDEGRLDPNADWEPPLYVIDQERARCDREAELLRVAAGQDGFPPVFDGTFSPDEGPTAADCASKFYNAPVSLSVKDSGTRREFSTGSVRDAATGKGRYDLLPPVALHIVAQLYEKGAEKYDARNWEKGQPLCEGFLDSAIRHAQKHIAGWRDEDHLAASAWNLLGAIHTEHQIARGKLPRELLDYPDAYVTEADVDGPVYEGEPCYKPEVPE